MNDFTTSPRTYLRSFIKDREGATIIEFAIVAPVFFLLIFAIVEFALIMYATSVLENATTAAGRSGITGNTGDTIQSYDPAFRAEAIKAKAVKLSSGLLNPGELRVETEIFEAYDESTAAAVSTGDFDAPDYGCGNQGVMYRAFYDWEIVTPFIGKLFTNSIYTIRSAIIVKNEDFDDDSTDPNCQ